MKLESSRYATAVRYLAVIPLITFGLLSILATGGGGGGGSSGTSGGGSTFSLPVADAGTDLTVLQGVSVTLDGSASFDPEGQALSFQWTQVTGPTVTLNNPTSAKPSFTAPSVATALTFELVVTAGSRPSAPDSVNVTVAVSGYEPVSVIDTPAGQRRVDNVRVAVDTTSGRAMALYSTDGQSTETDPGSAVHLFAVHFDGMQWGMPVQVDGAPFGGVVQGDVAYLGSGRYLAGWIEKKRSFPGGFFVKASFYDPTGGWGPVQTIKDYSATLSSNAYTNPTILYAGADPTTGNAFFVWEDLFDSLLFMDYRASSDSWNDMSAIAGSYFVDSVCDGVRCVLLTQPDTSLSLTAVHYALASGAITSASVESQAINFRDHSIVATTHGIYAMWTSPPDTLSSSFYVAYRRLPPGTTTWEAKQLLYTPPLNFTVGGWPRLAASATGEMKAFFTQIPVGQPNQDSLLARTYDPGMQTWSAVEIVRTPPAQTSGVGLKAAYVNDTDVEVLWPSSTGLHTQRFVAGSGWQTETQVDAKTFTYYSVELHGGLPAANEAMLVFDDSYVAQFNRTASGVWSGEQNMPLGLSGGSGHVSVATAPDGMAVATWIQWDLEKKAVYASHKPSGGSWQAPVRLTVVGDSATELRLVYAGASRFAAVWSATRSMVTNVYASTFDNASQLWSTPVAPVASGEAGFDDSLAIAADGAGKVIGVWYLPGAGSASMHAAVYDAAAGTWGGVVDVNDAVVTAGQAAAASGSADQFMVVWKESDKVRARSYDASMAMWSMIVDLDSAIVIETFGQEATRPTIASAVADEYMACWHIDADTDSNGSTDTAQLRCRGYSGATWAAASTLDATAISPASLGAEIGTPDLISGGTGDYLLGWRRNQQSSDTEWRVARYTAGSWQAHETVASATLGLSYGEHAAPTLRRDENGNLLMVWSEFTGLFAPTSGFAAYYDATAGAWQSTHNFEQAAGEVGLVRAAPRVGGGFELNWTQDNGDRFAVHASGRD